MRVPVANDDAFSSNADKALGSEHGFNTTVLDTVSALVVALDREGRIRFFNKACESTTGYSAREAVGKTVWDFVLIPAEVEAVKSVFGGLASGDFPNQHNNYWITKHGDRRLIAWSNTCLVDEEGAVEYVVGTGLDITEQRELERRTWQAESLAALGSMAAALAHEIRNPLNAAQLQVTLAERRLRHPTRADPVGALDALHVVHEELQRLNGLVRDALAFAQPSVPLLVCGDLREAVRGVAALIEPDVYHAGLLLRVSLDDQPVEARYDGQGMHQVLLNLVRNAMEAAPEGGTVTLVAQRRGRTVELCVEDTGPGPPEGIDVFEPFVTTKKTGSGLGLAIGSRIVGGHGGEISVRRHAGRTVFSIILPAASAPGSNASVKAPRISNATSPTLTPTEATPD